MPTAPVTYAAPVAAPAATTYGSVRGPMPAAPVTYAAPAATTYAAPVAATTYAAPATYAAPLAAPTFSGGVVSATGGFNSAAWGTTNIAAAPMTTSRVASAPAITGVAGPAFAAAPTYAAPVTYAGQAAPVATYAAPQGTLAGGVIGSTAVL